jgi:hypothetical protein
MIVMPKPKEGGASNEEREHAQMRASEPSGKSGEAEQSPEQDGRCEESIRNDSNNSGNEDGR